MAPDVTDEEVAAGACLSVQRLGCLHCRPSNDTTITTRGTVENPLGAERFPEVAQLSPFMPNLIFRWHRHGSNIYTTGVVLYRILLAHVAPRCKHLLLAMGHKNRTSAMDHPTISYALNNGSLAPSRHRRPQHHNQRQNGRRGRHARR